MTEKKSKPTRPGLYANIYAKQERIVNGSGEKMRQTGEKGAPKAENFDKAGKKTAKSKKPKAGNGKNSRSWFIAGEDCNVGRIPGWLR